MSRQTERRSESEGESGRERESERMRDSAMDCNVFCFLVRAKLVIIAAVTFIYRGTPENNTNKKIHSHKTHTNQFVMIGNPLASGDPNFHKLP